MFLGRVCYKKLGHPRIYHSLATTHYSDHSFSPPVNHYGNLISSCLNKYTMGKRVLRLHCLVKPQYKVNMRLIVVNHPEWKECTSYGWRYSLDSQSQVWHRQQRFYLFSFLAFLQTAAEMARLQRSLKHLWMFEASRRKDVPRCL